MLPSVNMGGMAEVMFIKALKTGGGRVLAVLRVGGATHAFVAVNNRTKLSCRDQGLRTD